MRSNNADFAARLKPTIFHMSRAVFQVPSPDVPGGLVTVMERKGHTYRNPKNQVRLRGKSALRRAKDARVQARIEAGIPTRKAARAAR